MFKKFFIYQLILTIGLVLSIALIVFILDPMEMYRSNAFFKTYFGTGLQNMVMAGKIRTRKYEAAIVSTSVGNTYAENKLKKYLKKDFVNLCIEDSNSWEIMTILESLKMQNKVKNIWLVLHSYAFRSDEVKKRFPDYLYGNDFTSNLKYLLNYTIALEYLPKWIITNIFRKGHKDLDPSRAYMLVKTGKEHDKKRFKINNNKKYNNDIYKHKEVFKRTFQKFVDENPHIKFTVILPPFHESFNCGRSSKNNFDFFVANSLIGKKNVEIFNFSQSEDLILNDNYFPEDSWHINSIGAEEIIKKISMGQNRLISLNNFDNKNKELKEKYCQRYK